MKRLLLVKILVFALAFPFAERISAQNLVPNPSFEDYLFCPNGLDQVEYALPWFNPTLASPDYFHSCSTNPFSDVPQNGWGIQDARTGSAYCGFITLMAWPLNSDSSVANFREYIEVKLNTPLLSGQKYYISFYLSLADSMYYGVDDVGVYFSIDTLKSTNAFSFMITPSVENPSGNFLTDKIGWMNVSGSYVAGGGEEFLTIGNFRSHLNTDTILVYTGSLNSFAIDRYYGYYFIDDVCVSPDSLECEMNIGINESSNPKSFHLSPNPTTSQLHFTLPFTETIQQIIIFTSDGRVAEVMDASSIQDEREINVGHLNAGFYLLKIKTANSVFFSRFIKI